MFLIVFVSSSWKVEKNTFFSIRKVFFFEMQASFVSSACLDRNKRWKQTIVFFLIRLKNVKLIERMSIYHKENVRLF